jgi:hypothetical protein
MLEGADADTGLGKALRRIGCAGAAHGKGCRTG